MKFLLSLALLGLALTAATAPPPRAEAAPPATPKMADDLGIAQGLTALETPEFSLKLGVASQDLVALQPKGAGAFDFAPSDRLNAPHRQRVLSSGRHHVSRAGGRNRRVALVR